jgi:hypothetical protein
MRRKNTGQQQGGSDYIVGYGRPPIGTRFHPGRSGNPKGRGKGARSAAAMAHSALERKIPVTEAGSNRSMSVREVALRRLAEKALSGDAKAFDFLLTLEGIVHASASDDPPETLELSDQDREVIENFLNRERLSKEKK